ncbi:MAG TPA: hypothetical protein VG897_07370, partial [Terriglobales bacterium]|nr:hypothetical protein [Terriglobales bacterium]
HVVVNPGSLGQPKTGNPDACYAVWENGQFQLKTFSYPVEKTIWKIEQLDLGQDIKANLIKALNTGSI